VKGALGITNAPENSMLRVKTATHRSPEARRKTISIFIFPGFYFIFIISCDTTMVKVQTD
jgi:hypothetical protein